ncbi:NADH-quinone oxidoreductase subunit B family protein [Thiomicrolovo sp. ZZH C-3]
MRSRLFKPKLIWLQGVTCNGNTHSFLNLPYLPQLLERFELLYHPLLPCTQSLEEIARCRRGCDVLVFEGAFDPMMERAGVTLERLMAYYGEEAGHVIAAGSCASFGGIFKASAPERNSGLAYAGEHPDGPLLGKAGKVINLSGCPVHPEWLGYTLMSIVEGRPVSVDALGRPTALYSHMAHDGCLRNEYFEWKVDVEQLGRKEGCLFYEHGCRGPLTHASCNRTLWNGVSSKMRVGTPCFGCTEPDFPRRNLFETKTNMSIPEEVPVGVSKRAYLTMTGIAKSFKIKRLEERLIDDD